MQITAEISLDDVIAEVEQAIQDSSSFDGHVNDLVNSLVEDQIDQHLSNRGLDPDEIFNGVRSEIEDMLSRLDIDEINDFERRSEEIARYAIDEVLDDLDSIVEAKVREQVEFAMTDAPDPQDAVDSISDLEQTVETLKAQVDALTEALGAVAVLLRGVVAG
jgi:Rps23 Pro-64 3,4-dihydroxylase Tpa1-like proline 4-hydroxylase